MLFQCKLCIFGVNLQRLKVLSTICPKLGKKCLKIKRPKVFASNVDCVLLLFVDMSITRANIGSDRFSFRYKVNSVGRPSSSDQQQTIPGESNDKNV